MRKAKRQKKKIRIWVLPLLVLILLGVFIRINTRYWNGKDKIYLVQQNGDGSVTVKVYDPTLEEVIALQIPGDTEVSVSRNLGTLRLKNVWQLGINEGLGGKLLTETVTKNFLFPVFLWRGVEGETNLPLGDRLCLKFFDIKTRNSERTEIDLWKSQFLKKMKLTDGETGYKLQGEMSERLTVYFVNEDLEGKRIYIKDATGTVGIGERVGEVIEVMGGKVVTIEKAAPEDSDCLVTGDLSKKIARVFSCTVGKGKTDFDLEVVLGRQFAKRY